MTTPTLDSLRFDYILALDAFFAAAKAHAARDEYRVDPLRDERLALKRAENALRRVLPVGSAWPLPSESR